MSLKKIIYKSKKGMTLIELIVTMAILSLIMIPLFSLSLTSAKISKSSDQKILATTLAQQCVESIKASGKNTIDFSSLGLSEITDTSTVDENETKTAILNGYSLGQVYKISGDAYRNMYVKLKYELDTTQPNKVDSDDSSYDLIFDLYKDSTDGKNKLDVNPLNVNPLNHDITGNKVNIYIENTGATIKYGYVLDGTTNLPSNYAEITSKKNTTSGNVKIIMHSTDAIDIDVLGKNDISSGNTLNIDFFKSSASNCTYNLNVDGDVKSKLQGFDGSNDAISSMDVNSLMKKYKVNVEIWSYNKTKNEKVLLQKIETSRLN